MVGVAEAEFVTLTVIAIIPADNTSLRVFSIIHP